MTSSTAKKQPFQYDQILLFVSVAIVMYGLIMLTSASIPMAEKTLSDALFYTKRQTMFLCAGVLAATIVTRIPLDVWLKLDRVLLLFSLILLSLVLVPGIGHEVNGSQRWILLGPFNLQVSELAKLSFIIFLSGYLQRHHDELEQFTIGFVRPLLVVAMIAVLLIFEPDFGAVVVITTTCLGMLFLAGVKLRHFLVIILMVACILAVLVITSPYRWERLTAFMNPWANQFNSGYQLTQSLIAFGRGEVFGTGLGSSIQKLFYLPEAHTDFLFAVIGEELGFVGLMLVIVLFSALCVRGFQIGRLAYKQGSLFAAFVAYGITIWLVSQAIINMGVNVGLLPTKGLTLPLMSSGGSSLIVCLLSLGILHRIHYEHRPVLNRRRGHESTRK